jgi:hypothetical protein
VRLYPFRFFACSTAFLFCLFLTFAAATAVAGGPKYVAGSSYFNPATMGQPIHWAGGQLNYYVDQGPLNSSVSNVQATAMVDAAAALWTAVPTAGVTLTNKGQLNEDVNGGNIAGLNQSISAPADVTPQAANYPLGVIYDADGSVLDGLFGTGFSDPHNCHNTSVTGWMDNLNPDATIAHGILILNGRCATDSDQLAMMSYELERAFGRILNLDYSQVNPGSRLDGVDDKTEGWPVMQPMSGTCGPAGGQCIPDPGRLRFDDIAALNRIYPITSANLAFFPGKLLTAATTVSIDGNLAFRAGVGMQGVNVVARPLDANGNPLYQYTVTFVSGSYFSGDHGNPVSAWTDTNGEQLSRWGSNNPAVQGYFDMRYMPLPPGITTASYQVTFESIDPMYIYNNSVGPYVDGSPAPSGTLSAMAVNDLSAGMSQTLAVNVPDSAIGGYQDAISTEASPRLLSPSGLWCGRLSQVGQADWFIFPVRANRTLTIVTQSLDEAGHPTDFKAMPALGVWDAFKPIGSPAVGAGPGLNGNTLGESWLRVTASGDDLVRLGIADMRGDYAYNGWVLYADTVEPQRLSATGGPIVIRGMGFHVSDTVLVGGQPAQVTSISPNQITAIAPPASVGITGSVDVEVDDLPEFYAAAILIGGISYDAGTGDALKLVTAPSNTVPLGVALPFTVTALGANLSAAGGVTVTFSISSGNAMLGCGNSTCTVVTAGDGNATMSVTAVDSGASIVFARLINGSSVQAHFSGGTPPLLAALTPTLSLAAGATVSWTTQALALNNGVPMAGQSVAWQTGGGITSLSATAVLTSSSGIAAKTLTVGPLVAGQQSASTACLNGTAQCVQFNVQAARPEYAWLEAIAGTVQTITKSATPDQIMLRLRDMNGNPMAGGIVSFHQALYAWAPPCPPHGRCAATQLLTMQTATATSGLDGTVTFVPASMPGIATTLEGLASSGNTSTLSVHIEQLP